MAIDPAADLAAIFASGDFPLATGTLSQDGADHAFTQGHLFGVERAYGGGDRDEERASLTLLPGDLGEAPQRDARVTFTGEERSWLVLEVTTVGLGPIPAGWTVSLRRARNKGESE